MTAQICAQFFCGFRWFQVESPLSSGMIVVLAVASNFDFVFDPLVNTTH